MCFTPVELDDFRGVKYNTVTIDVMRQSSVQLQVLVQNLRRGKETDAWNSLELTCRLLSETHNQNSLEYMN